MRQTLHPFSKRHSHVAEAHGTATRSLPNWCSLSAEVTLKGILITLAAIPISALLWGLFTGRWTAESRRARKLQAGAPPNVIMRIPVPWVFILVYLAGVAVQRVLPIAISSPGLGWMIRATGFVFIALGIVVAFSALGIFRKKKTTTVPHEKPSTLVTSGPYRFTRNPMYVGLTLEYLGVAGARLDIWSAIVLPLLLAYINFIVIPVEEQNLRGVFGDAYQQYGERVGRWL
jgi:protein-S-isoprenylcysteine O-methyltransferase Ste14